MASPIVSTSTLAVQDLDLRELFDADKDVQEKLKNRFQTIFEERHFVVDLYNQINSLKKVNAWSDRTQAVLQESMKIFLAKNPTHSNARAIENLLGKPILPTRSAPNRSVLDMDWSEIRSAIDLGTIGDLVLGQEEKSQESPSVEASCSPSRNVEDDRIVSQMLNDLYG